MQATTSASTLHDSGIHTQMTTSNVDNGFKPIILPQRLPTMIINPNSTTITTIMSPLNNDSSQLIDSQNKEISLASMLKVELTSGEDHDRVEAEIPTNTIFVNQPSHTSVHNIQAQSQDSATIHMSFNGPKTKRYKCEMCPYETDSKSQFQYHSSFHKPSRNESYQCKYCSYNVSKRHLLNQHMKMHTASGSNSNAIIDETYEANQNTSEFSQDNAGNSNEKYMHFCPMCPAHYLSLKDIINHINYHEKSASHKCEYCSFSSAEESNVKAHGAVHTSYYQEKTKEFMAKYKQASEYPKPELFAVKHGFDDSGASDDIWIVKNTSDKHKGHEQENHNGDENKIDEKCLYCPFQATSLEILKNHLQFHYAISGHHKQQRCEHCDFSCDSSERIREHNKLHFVFLINGNKNLDIFTSFRGLELNITKINPNDANNNVNGENIIYKEKDVTFDGSDSDRKEKVIIDV